SHEAFTRAFRDQFGVTPESVRAQGNLENIPLLEALVMSAQKLTIDPPRIENGKLLLIAGLNQRYATVEAGGQIPAQWQRFARYLGSIRGQVGQTTYGVCYNSDDEGNMDYLCGVEVSDFSGLPTEFSRLRLTPQKYAVFFHREHISAVRGTWNTIWNDWLPKSGYEPADAPLFERYDQRFDPLSGNGGVELWVPLKSAT
ncbi:MAG TPA: GyrI-like domain-containing protein, partial [Steroidobacteraceae bacterium]|nr:GyrI-like domain-containing protein [Steroidobacteraceae bacterium]